MKKLLYIAAILIGVYAAYTYVYAATDDCVCYIKVQPGLGCYEWKEEGQHCPKAGHNCRKKSCDDIKTFQIEEYPGGGYMIYGNLERVVYEVTDSTGNFEHTSDGSNYTFQLDDFLHIVDCPAYPNLNNLEFCLEGINTDQNGDFMYYIP